MAEYVWWFLIVGLLAGGGVVAFFMSDAVRRNEDVDAAERDAEASLIAAQLAADGRTVERRTIAAVLRADRDYRRLPPPDRFEQARPRMTDAEPSRPADAVARADADDDEGLAALARPRATGLARPGATSAGDGDADGEADDVRDGGGRGADEDLPPA